VIRPGLFHTIELVSGKVHKNPQLLPWDDVFHEGLHGLLDYGKRSPQNSPWNIEFAESVHHAFCEFRAIERVHPDAAPGINKSIHHAAKLCPLRAWRHPFLIELSTSQDIFNRGIRGLHKRLSRFQKVSVRGLTDPEGYF